ncbi:MAG: hypothetical protein ACOCSH_01710, partial [Candidatus Hadarchaeota archaeon]
MIFRVTKEAVAPSGVGYYAAVFANTQVIYPWSWSIGPGYDVLSGVLVKITILPWIPADFTSSLYSSTRIPFLNFYLFKPR